MLMGNPEAAARDRSVYMVETSAGDVVRCITSVFYDGGCGVISFHRVDTGGEVDAVQFVTAIERPSDADAVRPRSE
jgi:hypothetical protein